ncbi:hypothetical protein G6F59_015662 [Rhizopus arrhizus]|nr:hypothetical protein G6F59_015662 [Rhizopus arrhizus]
MHGGHLVEELGLDELQARLRQLGADHHAHRRADDEHDEAETQVQRADVLVVGREEPTLEEALLVMVIVVPNCRVRHCKTPLRIGCHRSRRRPRALHHAPLAAVAGALPASAAAGAAGASPAGAAGSAGAAGVAGAAGAGLRCASHCLNSSLDTASPTIGMKPWSLPHSSAHWPRREWRPASSPAPAPTRHGSRRRRC